MVHTRDWIARKHFKAVSFWVDLPLEPTTKKAQVWTYCYASDLLRRVKVKY